MRRRIYYDSATGIILVVTDASQTIEREVELYGLFGYRTGQTLAKEWVLTAEVVRNISDYQVDPLTGELKRKVPGPNPDEPWVPGPTPIEALQQEVDALELAVEQVKGIADEAKTQAVDGKAGLSAAITSMGVPAAPTDTFAVLSTKIGQIFTGSKVKSGSFASLAPRAKETVELGFVPTYFIVNAEGGATFLVSSHKNIAGLTFISGALSAVSSGTQLIIENPGTVQTRMNINYIAVS